MEKESLKKSSEILTKNKIRIKKPRLYKVVMFNDNVTTMDFVVDILKTIFDKQVSKINSDFDKINAINKEIATGNNKSVLQFVNLSEKNERFINTTRRNIKIVYSAIKEGKIDKPLTLSFYLYIDKCVAYLLAYYDKLLLDLRKEIEKNNQSYPLAVKKSQEKLDSIARDIGLLTDDIIKSAKKQRIDIYIYNIEE